VQSVVDTKPNTPSYTTTPNVFAAVQRDIEIARERGINIEDVFSHDHLLNSHLFHGDFTSATPDQIKLEAQLELNDNVSGMDNADNAVATYFEDSGCSLSFSTG